MHLFGRLASPLLTKARGVRKVQGSGVINKNRWDCAGSSSGGHRCGDKCKGLVRFDVCKTPSAVKRPTAEKGHKKKKRRKKRERRIKKGHQLHSLGPHSGWGTVCAVGALQLCQWQAWRWGREREDLSMESQGSSQLCSKLGDTGVWRQGKVYIGNFS